MESVPHADLPRSLRVCPGQTPPRAAAGSTADCINNGGIIRSAEADGPCDPQAPRTSWNNEHELMQPSGGVCQSERTE